MSKDIEPNTRVSKLAQYDQLTEKTQALADRFRNGNSTLDEKGKRVVNTSFVNADGEQVFMQINPRFLFGMYRTRDRAFKPYMLSE